MCKLHNLELNFLQFKLINWELNEINYGSMSTVNIFVIANLESKGKSQTDNIHFRRKSA